MEQLHYSGALATHVPAATGTNREHPRDAVTQSKFGKSAAKEPTTFYQGAQAQASPNKSALGPLSSPHPRPSPATKQAQDTRRPPRSVMHTSLFTHTTAAAAGHLLMLHPGVLLHMTKRIPYWSGAISPTPCNTHPGRLQLSGAQHGAVAAFACCRSPQTPPSSKYPSLASSHLLPCAVVMRGALAQLLRLQRSVHTTRQAMRLTCVCSRSMGRRAGTRPTCMLGRPASLQ
jgi:hypothetical protein